MHLLIYAWIINVEENYDLRSNTTKDRKEFNKIIWDSEHKCFIWCNLHVRVLSNHHISISFVLLLSIIPVAPGWSISHLHTVFMMPYSHFFKTLFHVLSSELPCLLGHSLLLPWGLQSGVSVFCGHLFFLNMCPTRFYFLLIPVCYLPPLFCCKPLVGEHVANLYLKLV
jgi:hypothetical protein